MREQYLQSKLYCETLLQLNMEWLEFYLVWSGEERVALRDASLYTRPATGKATQATR
jgi:hypothetical protein